MGHIAQTAQRPSNSDPQSVALMLALQRIFAGNRASDERFNLARMNLQDSAANRKALADQNQSAITERQREHDQNRAEAAKDRQDTDLQYKKDRDDKANKLKQAAIDARKSILDQRAAAKQKPGIDPNVLFYPSDKDPTMTGQDQELKDNGFVPVGPAVDPNTRKPAMVWAKQGSVYTDPQKGQAALDNYVQNYGKGTSPTQNPNGDSTGPMQGAQLGKQPKFTPGGASDTKANNAINADLASNPDKMSGRGELADAIAKIAGVDPSQQMFDGSAAIQGKDMGDLGGHQTIPGAFNPTALTPEMSNDGISAAGRANVEVVPVKPQTGNNGLTVRYQSSLDKVPAQYQGTVVKAAELAGVHPDVVASLLHQESGFNPNARSPAGAIGIGQFMPGTAREYGIDPRDPQQAIGATGKYLAKSLERYDGNLGLALASYNAGTGKTDAVLNGKGSFRPETVNYVKAITGQPIDAWISNKGDLTVAGNADSKNGTDGSTAGTNPAPVNQGGDPRMQQMLASAEGEDDDNLNALDQIRALYAGSINGMA